MQIRYTTSLFMTPLRLLHPTPHPSQKNFYSTFFFNIALEASLYIGGSGTFDALLLLLTISFVCRDKLRGNLLLKQHQLEVDLRHVGLYNDELAHAIQDRPADILPLVSPLPHSSCGPPYASYTYLLCSLRMQLLKLHAQSSSHSRQAQKNAQKLPLNRFPKFK